MVAGTVEADNPALDCRLPGLGARSPLRIVLAKEPVFAQELKLFSVSMRSELLLFHARNSAPSDTMPAHVTCIPVNSLDGRLWIADVLTELADRGVTRVLVEGGPGIWASFARAGTVDEAVLFRAGRGCDENVAMEGGGAATRGVPAGYGVAAGCATATDR